MIENDKWEQESNTWVYLILSIVFFCLLVLGLFLFKHEASVVKNQEVACINNAKYSASFLSDTSDPVFIKQVKGTENINQDLQVSQILKKDHGGVGALPENTLDIVALLLLFVLFFFLLFIVANYRNRQLYKQLLDKEVQQIGLKGHYDYIVRYANVIILLADEQLNILDANERAQQVYQYSLNELKKMKITDLAVSESEKFHVSRKKENDERNGSIYETVHRRKDGSSFPAEINTRKIKIDGRICLHQVIRDLTAQKWVETTLYQSDERLRANFNRTGDAIITTNGKGQVIHVNRVAEKLTGWSEKEAAGKFIREVFPIYHEDTLEEIENPVEKVLRYNMTVLFSNHTILRTKKGTEIPIGDSGAPIYDVNGIISRVVLVFRDQSKDRLTQKALAESERLYHSLANNVPVGMFRCNLNGYITYLNPLFCESLGLTTDQAMGRGWFKAVHPDDRERLALNWRKALQNNIVFNGEYRFLITSGHIVEVIVRVVPEINIHNKVFGYVGTVTDITQQKESERKFRDIFTYAPIGIYKSHEDGSFITANNQLASILGYDSIEELMTKNFIHDIYYNPEERAALISQLETIGPSYHMDTLWKKRDGSPVWIGLNVHAIKNEKNQIYYTEGFVQDITERKRMEVTREILVNISNAVLKSNNLEEFFSLVFSELGRLTTTRNFFVAIYNEETKMAKVPYTSDERERDLMEFPIENSLTGHVIKTKKTFMIDEENFERLRESGEVELIGCSSNVWLGVPLFSNEKVIGVIVLQNYEGEPKLKNEDLELIESVSPQISLAFERVKFVEDLKLALEKSQEADRLKTSFMAAMSHELRTPLNAVIGFSGLIDKNVPLDQIISYADLIERSGSQLLEIIEGIFSLTMLESGQIKIKKSFFSPTVLMNDLNDFIQKELKISKKEYLNVINVSGRAHLSSQLYSDQQKIKLVMIQLLKNAVKFTVSGEIQYGFMIVGNDDDNRIRFFVKDTGIGISADNIPIIFERFRQIDDTYTRKFGGTGIGLSIAKHFTEILGGDIAVKSEPGKGSYFYFTLPV